MYNNYFEKYNIYKLRYAIIELFLLFYHIFCSYVFIKIKVSIIYLQLQPKSKSFCIYVCLIWKF